MPEMKIPGPDHPITIEPQPGRVNVRFGGKTIAETEHALKLQEASYKPVMYIPRKDADMSLLTRTEHHSYCPYKGDASYYSIGDEAQGKNAVWSYEKPYAAVGQIKDYLAFYPDRVEISEG